ncbi:hypothetical protein F4780DRAFT_321979 [Xylariomycetidae sp. FL0641]|nr:hypothetical protein F4780DRAFT_321979 [Xylariomycetidae sp. FL0641]
MPRSRDPFSHICPTRSSMAARPPSALLTYLCLLGVARYDLQGILHLVRGVAVPRAFVPGLIVDQVLVQQPSEHIRGGNPPGQRIKWCPPKRVNCRRKVTCRKETCHRTVGPVRANLGRPMCWSMFSHVLGAAVRSAVGQPRYGRGTANVVEGNADNSKEESRKYERGVLWKLAGQWIARNGLGGFGKVLTQGISGKYWRKGVGQGVGKGVGEGVGEGVAMR